MSPSAEFEAARKKYVEAEKEARNYALHLGKHGGNDDLIHILKNIEEYSNLNPGWTPNVVLRDNTALTIWDQCQDARRELAAAG